MSAPQVTKRQETESEHRCRYAAGGQMADYSPIDRMRITVRDRADALRHGGVEQVCPDRRYRVNVEQQDQEWGRQRPAADPGHSHQPADTEPGQRIKREHLMHETRRRTFKLRQNLAAPTWAFRIRHKTILSPFFRPCSRSSLSPCEASTIKHI